MTISPFLFNSEYWELYVLKLSLESVPSFQLLGMLQLPSGFGFTMKPWSYLYVTANSVLVAPQPRLIVTFMVWIPNHLPLCNTEVFSWISPAITLLRLHDWNSFSLKISLYLANFYLSSRIEIKSRGFRNIMNHWRWLVMSLTPSHFRFRVEC